MTDDDRLEEYERLRAENERLRDELAIAHDAIEVCYDAMQSMDSWNDGDDAVQRTTLRRLNETIGKATPRLLMERPEGQKLYGLRWRELRAEVEEHRSAQAKVYLALGVDEPDRDKWPAIITKLKDEKEMWKARAEFMGWGEIDAAWGDE